MNEQMSTGQLARGRVVQFAAIVGEENQALKPSACLRRYHYGGTFVDQLLDGPTFPAGTSPRSEGRSIDAKSVGGVRARAVVPVYPQSC